MKRIIALLLSLASLSFGATNPTFDTINGIHITPGTGTLTLSTFTLNVPATGTVALLGTNNSLTGANTMTGVGVPLSVTTSTVSNNYSTLSVASAGGAMGSTNTSTGAAGSFSTSPTGAAYASMAGSDGTNGSSLNVLAGGVTLTNVSGTLGQYLQIGSGSGSAGELRITRANSAFYTGFKAGAVGSNLIYTLPTADGSSGQGLATNGSGVLSWATFAGLGANTFTANQTFSNASTGIMLHGGGSVTGASGAMTYSATGPSKILNQTAAGFRAQDFTVQFVDGYSRTVNFDIGSTGSGPFFGLPAIADSNVFASNFKLGGAATAYNFQDGDTISIRNSNTGIGQHVKFGNGGVGIVADTAGATSLRVSDGGAGYGGLLTGAITSDSLTASKPIFTNASKVLVSGSYSIPQIVARADLTGQTASNASVVTYTTPNDSAIHSFRVGGYVAITAISAGTLTVQMSFTDQNNTPQTLTYFAMGLTSSGLTTTGFTGFAAVDIRCKDNTAITFKTSFTGVSITYDVGGTIESLY